MLPRDAGIPEPVSNTPEPKPAAPRTPRPTPAGRPNISESHAQWGRGNFAAPPAALSSGPDAAALLKALRRRWLMAASLGLLIAGTAALTAWTFLSPKHTAFALIRVAALRPRITTMTTADTSDRTNEFATYQRTQAQSVKSRWVLNTALKREDVKNLALVREQPEPLTWLEDELKVEFKDGSEIVNVSMSGAEPSELVTLVKGVTESYIKEIPMREREEREALVHQLDDSYIKSREKVHTKRDYIKRVADALGTSDKGVLTQKQQMVLTQLAERRRQHTQIQFELTKAEAKLTAHAAQGKAIEAAVVTPAALNEALDNDILVKQFTGRITTYQDGIDRANNIGYRQDDSSLVRLRERLADAKKSVDERKTKLRTELSDAQKLKAKQDYDATTVQLKAELEPLIAQERSLKSELDQLAKDADSIGKSSTELEMLQKEIEQEENLTSQVQKELEVLRLEINSPPRVSLYQEAGLQKTDIRRTLILTILAPVASLILVCLGVAFWEYRARRIHTADEVIGAGVRVVGAVPPLPHPVKTGVMASGEDEDKNGQNMLESIDGIRTVLLRDASVEATRIVMVTSAGDGEAKTTLAAHLAGSLARAGRKTLLLDCDLRRPATHQLFEQTLQPGFSEVLLEEVNLAEAVRPTTAVEGLWLLPAGQWDREVIQALARDGVQAIFESLREEFEFVIVDSHPVLDAADSLLVGQHVDAVILSVLRDVSQVPRVYAAGQRLTSLGIRVLGAVVNGIPAEEAYSASYQSAAAMAAR
jgi:succinoglycan biosynthesis transport protein ExoP